MRPTCCNAPESSWRKRSCFHICSDTSRDAACQGLQRRGQPRGVHAFLHDSHLVIGVQDDTDACGAANVGGEQKYGQNCDYWNSEFSLSERRRMRTSMRCCPCRRWMKTSARSCRPRRRRRLLPRARRCAAHLQLPVKPEEQLFECTIHGSFRSIPAGL